jgi:peptidoglycan/xylan/chitin deacetylase (PgdA/CDA1 family)
MKPKAYITTSWDDGHPLDLRVADLLTKYGLRGTFYVPLASEHVTMTPAQVRQLSCAFEIGAHTLHHIELTRASQQQAGQEIVGGKSWIEDSTGQPCRLFCPPKGKYADRHLHLIRQAGYVGLRTVELLSLDYPRLRAGLLVLPTTVQAYPHGLFTYARNVIRRGVFQNFWQCIAHGRTPDWARLAEPLLERAQALGGVFHLWGHSWELQQSGQWQRLEEVLRFLSQFTGGPPSLTNGELCREYSGGSFP